MLVIAGDVADALRARLGGGRRVALELSFFLPIFSRGDFARTARFFRVRHVLREAGDGFF